MTEHGLTQSETADIRQAIKGSRSATARLLTALDVIDELDGDPAEPVARLDCRPRAHPSRPQRGLLRVDPSLCERRQAGAPVPGWR